MHHPGTIVNVLCEVISMSNFTEKDLPAGLTQTDFEKIPEIVPVRVRMTKSKLTPGMVLFVHKSIVSEVKK